MQPAQNAADILSNGAVLQLVGGLVTASVVAWGTRGTNRTLREVKDKDTQSSAVLKVMDTLQGLVTTLGERVDRQQTEIDGLAKDNRETHLAHLESERRHADCEAKHSDMERRFREMDLERQKALLDNMDLRKQLDAANQERHGKQWYEDVS